ncbi:2,3-bisphosphoglycerate-dependent phosphoglycerate mutase [Orenia metallireducens]|uniref:2,3-bisphosphoglycerate-dependent phosphoglycerate mutase n=1 Tax=Orenia metallireducens TaxID=1413210 RepID=A0A285IGV2_9FIRM|nr:histidine phosphatase family protein [Orenia metallireducens]PRX17819.1 2,3-bisphosphoglycerate-dependent phosphoglycerate mutase [Orenia metallireducens]SNY47194.1 2,3-bisphosphoglycerate-dependent phosphoglycerate mutase [Orenia metallireducens]
MTTKIYLVRHAQSKYVPHDDDFHRPLSKKGKEDVEKITKYFKKVNINRVLSSPYTRAVHTIEGVANTKGLDIELIDDFRERKVSNKYLDDKEFSKFVKHQWEDFNYFLEGGESLKEVQERGIKALKTVVEENEGKSIIIGTHGTWLGLILNYFDKKYDYEFWKSIKMPDMFLLSFEEENIKSIKQIKF